MHSDNPAGAFKRAADIRPDPVDPRRRLERRDFEMIHEDRNAIANLPTRFQSHEFPKEGGYFPGFKFLLEI